MTREEAVRRIDRAPEEKLTQLDLSGLDLEELPDENRLEYWLKLSESFGDPSPVIIEGAIENGENIMTTL